MKKTFKISIAIISFLLILLISVPYLFQDKIESYIKKEINQNLNAKVDYQDISLSLFKDFPNLLVSIKNIDIQGVEEFDSVRLAKIGEFDMSLNLKKLLMQDPIEIKKIRLTNPVFNILVLKNGKANYDLAKKNDNQKSENTDESNFKLKINQLIIQHMNLIYDDQSMGLKMLMKNMNQTGTGNFSPQKYLYQLNAEIDTLDVLFDQVHYIKNAQMKIQTPIEITNDFKTYNLDVKANLNQVDLLSKMFFDLQDDEDIKMDISYQTADNSLKKILSLIPAEYMPDLPNVQTQGSARLKGFVKGTYNDKNYPAFVVDFKINNGYIKYNDLPESIQNIHLVSLVNFPGGKNLDATKINLPKIQFQIAKNPVQGKLKIIHPMSDPYIDTEFTGKMDFSKLKQALKLSENGIKKIKGVLDANFKLKTSMSAVEQNQFDKIFAEGNFNLTNFEIKTDSLPYSIQITQAITQITPAKLAVKEFHSQIGESDFNIKGSVENYLQYILKKNKTLKADFQLDSQKINLNEFMTDNTDEKSNEEEANLTYIKVPQNLDIKFAAQAKEINYKKINLKNAGGTVIIQKGKAILNTVLSQAFGGQMGLTGTYDTTGKQPATTLKTELKKVAIPQVASRLSVFSHYAPILKKAQGNLFSNMQMNVDLDQQMNPIYNTLDMKGLLKTQNVGLNGIEVLQKIGELLKIDELKNPKIDQVKAQFEIDKGNLNIKPFDFKLNGMQSELGGKVSLDQKIDFLLKLDIPKAKLGGKANEVIENLVGKLSKFGIKSELPQIIKMTFKIKGDFKNPRIIPVFSGYKGKSIKEAVTKAVTEKVNQNLEQAKEKAIAEAQAKADALLKAAKAESDKLVSKAKKLAEKIRKESQKQADELVKKAGNNPLKKYAAQVAAKKLIEEADKKAKKIENEAQNKANLIMQNAQKKADKLLNDAKNKEIKVSQP